MKQFERLGFGEPFPISATHGTGTGDILDRAIEFFPPEFQRPEEEIKEEEKETGRPSSIRVAIVGQPNVGKSSLLNAILQQERSIVRYERLVSFLTDSAITLEQHTIQLTN